MDAKKVTEAHAEYMAAGAHREKPGQIELHEKTTDNLFVVEPKPV